MSNIAHDLHVETEVARALLASLRDIVGDDDQAKADAVEGETSMFNVLASSLERIFEVDALLAGIDVKAAELASRKARLEKQRDGLRGAIAVAMEVSALKKFEHALATVSLRAVPPKVEITDESAIPAKFFKQAEPKLDRKALLDALKAKEAVAGAVLSNGGQTISIKGA